MKKSAEEMKELLAEMAIDLEKAVNGNKTAAQRVRTASILFTKVAKVFRKESLQKEKEELGK